MDPGGVYECLAPKGSKAARKVPITLTEKMRRLKEERKILRRPKDGDSSDSDRVIDRRADRAKSKKRKRRRRRRKTQNLARKTTPGILNGQVIKSTREAKEEPAEEAPEAKRSRTIVEEMDEERATGCESGMPSVRPLSDAISHFAMNARESAKMRREEVAEGVGDAVDADIKAEAEGGGSGPGAAAPDEYRALFQECALTADPDHEMVDRSCAVWRLMEGEIGRDRAYRNAAVELMNKRTVGLDPGPELRPPSLGRGCDPDYVAPFLREAVLPLERPCVRGHTHCVAMSRQQTWPDTLQTAKPESGHIMREFWTPDEWSQIEQSGRLPPTRRKCRLCQLWTIKRAYMMLKSTGLSLPAEGRYLIQSHWDVVSEPGTGGYTAHDMLPVTDEKTGRWNGLVAPVLDYRASRYESKIHEVWDPEAGEMRKAKGLVEKDQDF